jgi:hypothetical protein
MKATFNILGLFIVFVIGYFLFQKYIINRSNNHQQDEQLTKNSSTSKRLCLDYINEFRVVCKLQTGFKSKFDLLTGDERASKLEFSKCYKTMAKSALSSDCISKESKMSPKCKKETSYFIQICKKKLNYIAVNRKLTEEQVSTMDEFRRCLKTKKEKVLPKECSDYL